MEIKYFMLEHGGAREGAGRPKGRLNRRTLIKRKIQEDLALRMSNLASDISPLDLLLELGRTALKLGDLETAASAMTIALPYCHARKSPVQERDPNAPTLADIMNDTDPLFMEEPLMAGVSK